MATWAGERPISVAMAVTVSFLSSGTTPSLLPDEPSGL
jgi:hypothetical protein